MAQLGHSREGERDVGKHFPYPRSDFAKEHYGKGVNDGRREGESELLLRPLTHRFGELPAEIEARVRAANDASLERWAVRLLDATTVDAVFADG